LFISPLYSNEELEEKLYSKMTDYNAEKAVENLLIALDTIEDGSKYTWESASYEGYIIPINTIINEEGYFCRNYMEVLIRRSEYNIYEKKACRDHDGEWVWFETTSANKSSN
jgi:surface antigen